MHNGVIIALILAIIGIAVFVGISLMYKREKIKLKPAKIIKGFGAIIFACALIVAIFTLIISMRYQSAKKRGAYTSNITIQELNEGIRYSPIEDELPENLEGAIVIFYKFDCPDCHAIYNDLKDAVSGHDNIYWVSSRSEQGKALLANYPIPEVPYGVYFRTYTYGGNLNYTKKVLYCDDANGNTVLNETNLNRLFELQTTNK